MVLLARGQPAMSVATGMVMVVVVGGVVVVESEEDEIVEEDIDVVDCGMADLVCWSVMYLPDSNRELTQLYQNWNQDHVLAYLQPVHLQCLPLSQAKPRPQRPIQSKKYTCSFHISSSLPY